VHKNLGLEIGARVMYKEVRETAPRGLFCIVSSTTLYSLINVVKISYSFKSWRKFFGPYQFWYPNKVRRRDLEELKTRSPNVV
jgi:hypothetical protein